MLFVFSKFSKWGIEPGFRLPLLLVAGKIFMHGTCAKWSNEYSRTKNYLLLCSHLKFRYFNFCDVFSQRSQSNSFLSQLDISRRSKDKKKTSQNGRPTALVGLREDIFLNKNYRAFTSFHLRRFFPGTLGNSSIT